MQAHRIPRRALSAAALAVAPTIALAHPGPHEPGIFANLAHLLSSPDHLALLAATSAVLILGLRVRRLARLRRQRIERRR